MSVRAQDEVQPFTLQRLGVVMEPRPGDPNEAWGVLNPGAARDPGGVLYLFPRLVAAGNYSRIGIAQVHFDAAGIPVGVGRMGLALEPREPYERNPHTGGGVEDARVTFVRPLNLYVLTYTALGPMGPRVALATSTDLLHWTRLGPMHFAPAGGLDLNPYHNKDASFFPDAVVDLHGRPALVVLHRPTLYLPGAPPAPALSDPRASIWISYVPLEPARADVQALTETYGHTILATPQQPWEALKIGGGPPPILTPLGWVVLYHGVSGQHTEGVTFQPRVRYSAGALVLDKNNLLRTLYRSSLPILEPRQEGERIGIVPNVVFPTGIDAHAEGTVDVYYGMADSRIGAARLILPTTIPQSPVEVRGDRPGP